MFLVNPHFLMNWAAEFQEPRGEVKQTSHGLARGYSTNQMIQIVRNTMVIHVLLDWGRIEKDSSLSEKIFLDNEYKYECQDMLQALGQRYLETYKRALRLKTIKGIAELERPVEDWEVNKMVNVLKRYLEGGTVPES